MQENKSSRNKWFAGSAPSDSSSIALGRRYESGRRVVSIGADLEGDIRIADIIGGRIQAWVRWSWQAVSESLGNFLATLRCLQLGEVCPALERFGQ